MPEPSIRKHITSRDWYEIREAIRANKYWNFTENTKSIVYALALSRARTPANGGRYVKTAGVGQVIAGERQRWFCRKYRVLLVDLRSKTVISVLTWNAFKIAIRDGKGVMVNLLYSGALPPYINYKTMKKLLKYNLT